jgi:hypothetical protein
MYTFRILNNMEREKSEKLYDTRVLFRMFFYFARYIYMIMLLCYNPIIMFQVL